MGSYTGVHGLRPEGVFRGAVLVPDTAHRDWPRLCDHASSAVLPSEAHRGFVAPTPPLDTQPEAMYLLAGARVGKRNAVDELC